MPFSFCSVAESSRKPYTLILVDEIEKAAKEFVTIFLQVLDDGRLTDGKGRVVDFKNTIILFTSNLGAAYLNEAGEGPITPEIQSRVRGAVSAHFVPEFLSASQIFISRCFNFFCRGEHRYKVFL